MKTLGLWAAHEAVDPGSTTLIATLRGLVPQVDKRSSEHGTTLGCWMPGVVRVGWASVWRLKREGGVIYAQPKREKGEGSTPYTLICGVVAPA